MHASFAMDRTSLVSVQTVAILDPTKGKESSNTAT